MARNENFSQAASLSEKESEMGGFMTDSMKIVPALPMKDAEELLRRFSGLIEEYGENTEIQTK